MRNISFIINHDSGTITAFVNNESYPIARDNRYYDEIKQAIIDDNVETFLKFANLSQSVQNFSKGKVEVKDGQVFYSGQVVHNVVTEHILNLMKDGFPFEPICHFLENVMENSSRRAVEELYNFLVHQNLPITEDGHFLAYKRVDEDWLDFHSRTFDNHVGQKPSVPRNQVDDDFRKGCSYGLHVGSIAYVKDFNSGGHVIICKVNPKDVVSVPEDCNNQKCRVTDYEVVGEYTGDLKKALYTPSGAESVPTNPWVNDDDDEEWNDDDEYDDDDDDDFDDDDDDDEYEDDDDN